jgi:hypothetical protein
MNIRWNIHCIVFCAMISLIGCVGPQSALSKTDAIAIAKQEVRKHGWLDFDVDDCEATATGWSVTLSRNPKVPGGHATVEISRAGKVARYLPGL